MKIFRIGRNDTAWFIYLMGCRFEFNKSTNLYSSIVYTWKNKGATTELLSLFKILYYNPRFWNKSEKNIWLIYISCLLEVANEKEALRVLKQYIKCFGLVNIEKFLPVAHFALKHNIVSSDIEIASNLFCKFEEACKNNFWINYLKGKSIAVVGNGYSLRGLNKGNEIDSHDVVIRFNRFVTDGYETDCGTKTNIWVKNESVRMLKKTQGFLNLLRFDYWHRIANIKELSIYLENNTLVDCIVLKNLEFARRFLEDDFYNPTAGAIVILALYEHLQSFDKVDFYGFNFLEEKYKPIDHYYHNIKSTTQIEVERLHSFEKECRFLKKLVCKEDFSN